MIKTRSKKVEAKAQVKRARETDQKKRAQGGGSTTSSSSSANDGSKEGRRAERDRRRDEHRSQTGAEPKTPEQIAEIERRRRIRMEDAESAWTVQDGDLPPEGEPVGDEGDLGDYTDDDDDDNDGGDNDSEGDDDEEVLDLD